MLNFMLAKNEITKNILALLSQKELSKVSESVCQLIAAMSGSGMVALFYWDSDLEILTNRHLSNDKASEEKFLKEFAEKFESKQDPLYLLDEDFCQELIPQSWQPFYCYEVSENNQLYACLLFTNKQEKMQRNYLLSYVLILCLWS